MSKVKQLELELNRLKSKYLDTRCSLDILNETVRQQSTLIKEHKAYINLINSTTNTILTQLSELQDIKADRDRWRDLALLLARKGNVDIKDTLPPIIMNPCEEVFKDLYAPNDPHEDIKTPKISQLQYLNSLRRPRIGDSLLCKYPTSWV